MQFDYECALTGLTQEGAEYFDDELGDLPAGWTKVMIQRREYNPKWLMIQQVKQLAIQGLIHQLPPEAQQSQAWMVSLQVEAQFIQLETATPMFLTAEDVAYISNNGEVVEPLNELRDTLGLPPVEDDDDDDDDDDEEEDDTSEEETCHT